MKITIKETRRGATVNQLILEYDPPIVSKKTGNPVYEEPLKFTVYRNPANPRMKLYNQETFERAEKIRQYREMQIKKGEIRLLKVDYAEDLVSFYRKIADTNRNNYKSSFLKFSEFCNGVMPFEKVNPGLFIEYRDFLIQATKIDSERPLSILTANCYFNQFRYVLREAHRSGCLSEDLHDCGVSISVEDANVDMITPEEISRLMAVPCMQEDIPRMCMFIVLTGVRYGFLMKLRWEDVNLTKERRPFIIVKTQRSGRQDIMYISKEAYNQLGKKKKSGPVFSENGKQNLKFLHRWLHSAGLRDTLTFESFRLNLPTLPKKQLALKR